MISAAAVVLTMRDYLSQRDVVLAKVLSAASTKQPLHRACPSSVLPVITVMISYENAGPTLFCKHLGKCIGILQLRK